MFTNKEVDVMTCFHSILICALACGACNAFDREIDATPVADCETNVECTTRLSAGGATVPAVCVKDSMPRCVQLTSEDCSVITGDYKDDKAVLIATLLSTTGAQAATNTARQQSAILAVEEINAANGILQSTAPGDAHKLLMVSCDEVANFSRVTNHLVKDLHVSAIVGPNLSQHMLDLVSGSEAMNVPSAAKAGVAVVSPAAVAAQIATVPDDGLSFMMVPSDYQRMELMKKRINDVEAELKTARSKDKIKLGVWYRNDAISNGTRDGLSQLKINGEDFPLAVGNMFARADGYALSSTDNLAKVMEYIQFKPDIIVISGTAEAVTYFVNPLEQMWTSMIPGVPKPYYISIDSTKVPELQTAATNNASLRTRWSGTGVAPPEESKKVFAAFQSAYQARWKDMNGVPQSVGIAGMGPSYDTIYAIALALVGKTEVNGRSIADGLVRLANNPQTCEYDLSNDVKSPCFAISDHARTLYTNMTMLLGNMPVTEIGTFGRFEWDSQGAKSAGRIEVWCINQSGPATYASSGMTYDLEEGQFSGMFKQCGS
jgi:ABC-type branched-subunit amino acid transport system substrate-binding protein